MSDTLASVTDGQLSTEQSSGGCPPKIIVSANANRVVQVARLVPRVVASAQRSSVVVASASNTASVVTKQNTVSSVVERTSVVKVASPGPQGPAGVNGADGGTYATKIAATALGGHRIVRTVSGTDVGYASNDDVLHGDDVLGMTLGAASAGAVVQVANEQDITEPSWSWTPQEPLYLGLNGLVTQTPPESPAAFALVVGFATSATSARIRIEQPVYF